MIYTRTPISMASAVSLLDIKDHLRIDHDYDESLLERMGYSVALEFEDLCNIALLAQTITATSDVDPGTDIALPVGPVADDAAIMVQALAEDGTTSAITAFWLEAGRYPVVHLTDTPTHRVRVTYTAALATSAGSVPADIQMALADQVARIYTQRGGIDDRGPALSPHTARVVARYRRASL